MRPSLKRTVLIFANLNTLFFFLAFVIIAGALPPCWKKDGVSGQGNIGAPAYLGFYGMDQWEGASYGGGQGG